MTEPVTFLLLALVSAAGWFWWASTRSREIARVAVAMLCKRYGLQLLDQSVALERVRLGRHPKGHTQMQWRFGFAYSDDGFERQDGVIWLHGNIPQWGSIETRDGRIHEHFDNP